MVIRLAYAKLKQKIVCSRTIVARKQLLIGLIFSFIFLSKERKRLSKLAQNSAVNGPVEVLCNIFSLSITKLISVIFLFLKPAYGPCDCRLLVLFSEGSRNHPSILPQARFDFSPKFNDLATPCQCSSFSSSDS